MRKDTSSSAGTISLPPGRLIKILCVTLIIINMRKRVSLQTALRAKSDLHEYVTCNDCHDILPHLSQTFHKSISNKVQGSLVCISNYILVVRLTFFFIFFSIVYTIFASFCAQMLRVQRLQVGEGTVSHTQGVL